MSADIRVEVVYALPEFQYLIPVVIKEGSTIEQAIFASNLHNICKDIEITNNNVGIFGKLSKLQDRLQDGDRVEIYRPLLIDPKDFRRNRMSARSCQ